MNKTAIAIVLGVFLLSFAIAMYLGECSSIDLSDLENPNDVVYTIIGNSSNTEGMSVLNNGTFVEVCFDLSYESDNFTLVFMDKITEEVIQEVIIYKGGGGSTKYVENKTIEYIDVERTVYVDVESDCPEEVDVVEEEKVKFFGRIWNWIKGIFTKN